MSHPAKSMLFFGIYVAVFGVAITLAPLFIVNLFGLPPAPLGWIRVVGLLCLVIAAYDIASAWIDSALYYKVSIVSRFAFAIAVTAVVVAGEMPPSLLPLAVIDIAGATWTLLAMNSRKRLALAN